VMESLMVPLVDVTEMGNLETLLYNCFGYSLGGAHLTSSVHPNSETFICKGFM